MPCMARICVFKCGNCENAVSVSLQTEHLNGFSPVCLRMWSFRTLEWANACQQTCNCRNKQQQQMIKALASGIHECHSVSTGKDNFTWHLYGLSPEWIRWCTISCDFCENVAPQLAHPCDLTFSWVRMCCGKCPLNVRLQMLQKNAFTFSW